MNGLSSRERTIVMVGVGIALLVGVPGLMGAPAARGPSLAGLKQERRDVQQQLARLRRESETLEQAIGRRVTAGTSRQLIQRMVQAAQGAAQAAGLRITDLKPTGDDAFAGLQRVSLEMTLSAGFPEAVRFLYELERAGRPSTAGFRVDDLQMIATDPRNDTLDLELRLIGFVKPEEQEDGSGS